MGSPNNLPGDVEPTDAEFNDLIAQKRQAVEANLAAVDDMTSVSAAIPRGILDVTSILDRLPPEVRAKASASPPSEEDQAALDLAEWEDEQDQKRKEQLLRMSNLSPRYQRMTFANYDIHRSSDASRGNHICQAYAKSVGKSKYPGLGLFIHGGVGTGKTHLAVSILQVAIDRGVPSLFVTLPDLLDHYRAAFNDGGEAKWDREAKYAKLLVLDDVGAERPTEWVRERIYSLINHRFLQDLATIYTSNLRPQDLAGHLGERTASRILGHTEQLIMTGEDQRLDWRR